MENEEVTTWILDKHLYLLHERLSLMMSQWIKRKLGNHLEGYYGCSGERQLSSLASLVNRLQSRVIREESLS